MPKITKQTMAPVRKTTGDDFLDSIRPVSELNVGVGIKMLMTGPPGSGKTSLGCSAPKPLCLIRPEQVENGNLSVKNVPGVFSPRQLTEDGQLVKLIERQQETQEWKSMFLDGVQFYQDLVLKRVLGLKEVPAQLSWGIATQQDWGVVTQEFKEIMRRFLQLAENGTNILISGSERTINAEEGSIVAPSIVVALAPSSAGWMNLVCDYIVTTFVRSKMKKTMVVGDQEIWEKDGDEIEWCARTKPTDIYLVKFRVPKGTPLPPVVVDPTWDKLYKLMQGVADVGIKSKKE